MIAAFLIHYLLGGFMPQAHAAPNRVLVHGHRGTRGTRPENTLPAFQEAVRLGVDVLELDLHLTKDDIPVVIHDPFLTDVLHARNDGKPIATPVEVRALELCTLQTYDFGRRVHPRFPEQIPVPNTKVLTLEELLQWLRDKRISIELNIETKMDGTPALIPAPELFSAKVVALLQKYGMVERAILQSFDFRTLTAAKALEPKLRLSCLFEKEENFCDKTAAVGAHIASPDQKLVTSDRVKACHAKQIEVVPWTANTPPEWDRLIASGVDAIITDYPAKLIEYLKTNR